MRQIRVQSIIGVLSILATLMIANAFLNDTATGISNGRKILGSPYFGLEAPGSVPQPFAPALFVDEVHSCPIFSRDLKEIYWDPMDNDGHTLYMTLENETWGEPQKVPFDSKYGTYDPCFSPDGMTLYYASNERITGGKRDQKKNLWHVKRVDNEWSEPTPLPSVVNCHDIHWQMSVAESGNLYFGSDRDIQCAYFVDGQYERVEKLGDAVNSDLYEGTPFVAPDESYIIFGRHGGNISFADLFISFRDSIGSWTPAISMGDGINSAGSDLCPQVSPDGKYFFFLRNDQKGEFKPFWVDAGIIEELRIRNLE